MKNRPERIISFLVVWLTMFSFISVNGQVFYKKGLKGDFLRFKYSDESWALEHQNWPFYEFPGLNRAPFGEASEAVKPGNFRPNALDKTKVQTGASYNPPSNIYYLQSGFFCKREWELEKATHIPFRFRLGSLADCNAMEGKR
jgi:hypothetical protein